MNSLLRASSVSSLVRGCGGINCFSRFSSQSNGFFGRSWKQETSFPRASGEISGEGSRHSATNAPSFQNFTRSAVFQENRGWWNSKSMETVKGILEDEGSRRPIGGSSFYRPNAETNAEVVHIKMLRNNTFVTVTDSKGNVKCRGSSGCLPELKGGPKLSRYAAEATAEHIGRKARTMGLKSVVVKVNGFIHFRKKRQAIVAFKEGFNSSRSDQNPIVYIEDTTRRAHNGCRLPRKRRI
ncbi:PREDICTED: probable ribosomal protein S11, mitochondrial [Tarenaya hassleriana]|uniref:probable ribosomal protein S11, mitochondrial n=1 Tax=Tarenaya hassleriana TaxID=28532 RepID=UPI00053C1CD8|nr:PREDICTED: probable ribosomal protein S11, mitochondrial [Tarenaya hassleriana]XP_010518947.1 PREDICTED: probable ribosomal protein S11, mitochondrial [Tarenaya hassleriana]